MTTTSDLFDLGLDELFFEVSLTGGYYELITVDGLDCYAEYQGGGYGCPLGGDFVSHASINLEGEDGGPKAYIDLWGSDGGGGWWSIYSSGSHDVVDNQDGTYTVNMDTVLQDGSETPLVWTGTFVDMPGFVSTDEFWRHRGGSSITVSYLGSVLVFESQSSNSMSVSR